MISDTDLPHQPEILQQSPLMKRKSNRSWISFSILLIIINLLFIWLFPFIFLLPFAIIDFIAVIYFIRKKPPPWIIFLILLFALNVIFFSLAGWALKQTSGGVAVIVIIPAALILLLIDLIAIYIHLHSIRAKAIFYTALLFLLLIVFGFLVLSTFYSGHP
jgi:hypothetical protein